MLGRDQALDHLAVFQVRLDNFIDVGFVHVAVPNAFRINNGHRPTRATVKATRFVDTDLPRPRQTQ